MKILSLIGLSFVLISAAQAEQCATKTEEYKGQPITVETCQAPVEEALIANSDGYRFVAYVVTYQGQRVVIADTLGRSNYSTSNQVCFLVMKHDLEGEKHLGFEILFPPGTCAPETR